MRFRRGRERVGKKGGIYTEDLNWSIGFWRGESKFGRETSS